MAKRGKSPRAQVPLRIPEAQRARIEKAAKARGASMNAEIVERLARSFDIEDRLGGPRVVELIETIAGVMKLSGEHAAFMADSSKLHNQGEWLDQPYGYDQARKAAITVLKKRKPKGAVVVPKPPKIQVVGGDPKETEKRIKWLFEHLGEELALKEMRDRKEKK